MAVMKRYEMLVLLEVGLNEDDLEAIIVKIKEMVEASEGGEILTLDRWGKKRLAYEINRKQFGYYVLYEFTAPSSLPSELDRFCRLDTGVVRHMILVIDDHILRLKEREEKIRTALTARRQTAQEENEGKETEVEDLLEKKSAVPDAPVAEETVEKVVAEEVVATEPVEEKDETATAEVSNEEG